MSDSPSSLFDRLGADLARRQTRIQLLDNYYRGQHPMPTMPDGASAEFRRLQEMCRANFCGLVVDTSADGLRLVGVRRGEGASSLDDGLDVWRRWWEKNKLSRVQRQVFTRSLSCERSFLLVWPRPIDADGNPTGPARITVESPRQMIVDYVPGSTTERRAALKQFRDDEWVYQVLWTADAMYRRRTRAATTAKSANGTSLWTPATARENWEPYYLDGEDPATMPNVMIDGQANPVGRVPVVEFAASPDDEGIPTSEMIPALPAQDRINQGLIHRVFTQENMSWPHRLLFGEEVHLDPETKEPVNPLKAGPDRVSQLKNKDAKVDQWDAAEVTGFLATYASDIEEITTLTRTPPTTTIAKLANIGAEALQSLSEAHIKKLLAHQDVFSDPAEEVLYLAALADGEQIEDGELEMLWADPAEPSLGQRATAMQQVGATLPQRVAYEEVWRMSPQAVQDALAADQEDALTASLAVPPVAPTPVQ